jgi:hypothetical protein
MPTVPILEKPFYNTSDIEGSIADDGMFNCHLERVPGVGLVLRRRPGLSLFTEIETAKKGDGLYYWDSKEKLLAIVGGVVYDVASDGTLTNITTDALVDGTTVTFADGQKLDGTPVLYMANGALVYSDDGGNTTEPTDASTPTTATHVAYINLRFIANNPDTNQFLFTDTNPATSVIEFDYWSSSDNPLAAESRGDLLSALHVGWQEIYPFGQQSIEVWQDDGFTPFAPVPNAAVEVGLEAPYSIKIADNRIFFLGVTSDKRVIISLTGRTPTVISEPIGNILAEMDTVSDAIGSIVSVGGLTYYILFFPTADQTWAYDYVNDIWSRWSSWDTAYGKQKNFIAQHAVYVKPWNKHLIMSNTDGKIYEMSRQTFDDNGLVMKSYKRSKWINHGNEYRTKKSSALHIKLLRGSQEGKFLIRWRDNGKAEWNTYQEIDVGPVGDRTFIYTLRPMGQYKSRQYEVLMTDAADLALVGMEEEVELLRF